MALITKVHYTYRDVTILPCNVSTIGHRAECNPFNPDGRLPLFTAPMNTVVNEGNFSKFEENGIIPILPRTEPINLRVEYAVSGKWAAFSLNEFSEVFCISSDKYKGETIRALIDVANGHMEKILELSRSAKGIYGDKIEIMAGNIANPDTFISYARAGIDYVRCGIGSGMGCLSTSNTGVHMPMASLINEIKEIRDVIRRTDTSTVKIPKIVADGGTRNYSDIIKALALGADYVMCGGIFASMEESAAPKEVNEKGETFATFYGMASREGQIAMNGAKTKTSEGVKKKIPVLYSMAGWVENFKDYLRSAMSYAGARALYEFKEYTNLIVNSENAINVVNK